MKYGSILVTGGAGYIGSHTVKELKKKGYSVVVLDDLSYGNKELVKGAELVIGDIADIKKLDTIIEKYKPVAAIHFAAFKDAAESVFEPEKYFENNTKKSKILIDHLIKRGINKIIFSSSASVYGDIDRYPITENFPIKPINPYGESKAQVEELLLEYQKNKNLQPIIFRYFNAGGADIEGELGNMYPAPKDVISVIMRAANDEEPSFTIFGTNFETRDGTAIRDIVHVADLARAHVLGLEKLLNESKTGIFNLGSENGYSIKEIVETAKKVTKKDFPVVSSGPREGDIIVSIASSQKAKKELGWKPQYNLEDIIITAWQWHNKMPTLQEKTIN